MSSEARSALNLYECAVSSVDQDHRQLDSHIVVVESLLGILGKHLLCEGQATISVTQGHENLTELQRKNGPQC